MSKPWLQSYPEGVPAEISIEEYASVADIFDQSVCKFENLPAYSNFGKTITYKEVRQFTSQMGAYLKHELGLEKGTRVAVMMPTCCKILSPYLVSCVPAWWSLIPTRCIQQENSNTR